MSSSVVGFWSQVWWVIRKDVRIELRSGEALMITVPFGAMALMMVPMAIGTDTPLLSRLGPGMLWLVVLLFGMLVTFRSTSLDTPVDQVTSRSFWPRSGGCFHRQSVGLRRLPIRSDLDPLPCHGRSLFATSDHRMGVVGSHVDDWRPLPSP